MERDDLNAIAAQLLKLESQVARLKRTVESFGDATKIQSGERLEELLDPVRHCDPDPRRIVVAEEFILVDQNGKARARLAMEDGVCPMLSLMNEDRTRNNVFILTAGGSGILHLGNREGEEIILSVAGSGDKVVSIVLVDRDGLTTRIGREPAYYGSAKGPRGDSAASVALTDKDGKVLWSAP
jgi:hypothetical protein